MHKSCSDTMPPLNYDYECGQPLAMSHTMQATYKPGPGEVAFLNKIIEESDAKLKADIDAILAQVTPALAETPERLQLAVSTEEMAVTVREHLAERGHGNIDVIVANPLDDIVSRGNTGNYWTPEMSAAKLAYANAYDALGQRVRHHSKFTKSQPNAKARKATRKRAKAGRRASR